MNDLMKNGFWGILTIVAVVFFALFYHGLNKSFEKNLRKGLFLIIISFVCGIILLATSLHFFAVEHPPSKLPVQKDQKVVLD